MTTPMLQVHSVTLEAADGTQYTYEIRKMNVVKAAVVAKTLAATVLPVISGLKVGSVGSEGKDIATAFKSAVSFDVGSSVEAVCAALGDMEEERLGKLLVDLFSSTSVIGHDQTTRIPLKDSMSISIATGYDLSLVGKLALEVVSFCLPFGAKAKHLYGLAMQTMSGFGKQVEKELESRSESELSESSEKI